MSGRGVHRATTLALSLAMVAIGLAVLGESLGQSSGLSSRLLLGVLFVAAGGGRLYLLLRRGRT